MQQLSYLGIFLWFLFTQLIVIMPIPEEVVLLLIGYLSARGVWEPFIAGAIAYFTLLLADNIFYFLARSGNRWVLRIMGKREGKFRQRAEAGMKRNMPKTLFGLTFVPRLRFFGPIMAGALRVRWWVFLVVDAAAIFIFVSIYVSIGFIFHNSIARLFKGVLALQAILVAAAVVVIAIVIVVVLRRRHKRHKAEE
jgi:membrane protein DedA with SNARE-associated domain